MIELTLLQLLFYSVQKCIGALLVDQPMEYMEKTKVWDKIKTRGTHFCIMVSSLLNISLENFNYIVSLHVLLKQAKNSNSTSVKIWAIGNTIQSTQRIRSEIPYCLFLEMISEIGCLPLWQLNEIYSWCSSIFQLDNSVPPGALPWALATEIHSSIGEQYNSAGETTSFPCEGINQWREKMAFPCPSQLLSCLNGISKSREVISQSFFRNTAWRICVEKALTLYNSIKIVWSYQEKVSQFPSMNYCSVLVHILGEILLFMKICCSSYCYICPVRDYYCYRYLHFCLEIFR